MLESIITKIVHFHHHDWDVRISEALWAYHTIWGNTTSFSQYELVYGKNALFPIEFEVKSLRTTLNISLDLTTSQKHKLDQLNELDEYHQATIYHISIVQ